MRRSIFYILTIVILLILIILIGVACWDDRMEILPPPRPRPSTIQLTAEDVGVTDVMLKIGIMADSYPHTVTLKRDTVTVLTTTLTSPDTMIFDEGLLPKHTYRYTLSRPKGQRQEEIKNISITTMDTTSHNFTWEIDTLGDGNSSVLRDVAIINDTCAWAVGEIYKKDSLGNWDYEPYGAAIWNGNNWRLMKVPYHDYGSTNTWPGPLRAVYAFGVSDVYVASSANLLHWDGKQWAEKAFFMTGVPFTGQVNKIWGTSGSNLFCVGNSGAIYSYDGKNWQKMESETDVDLTDVWGSPDGSVVWACGWIDFKPTVLLKHKNNIWEKVHEELNPFTLHYDSLSGILVSVWVKSPKNLFILTHLGLYKYYEGIKRNVIRYSFTQGNFPNFPHGLRGNNYNDMCIVGSRNFIAHFNGVTWRNFEELLNSKGRLRAISQKENIVIAVGNNYDPINGQGLAFIGRR